MWNGSCVQIVDDEIESESSRDFVDFELRGARTGGIEERREAFESTQGVLSGREEDRQGGS